MLNASKDIITKDTVHYLFNYEDGHLIWKISPSVNVKSGDVAGCINFEGYIKIAYKRKTYLAHRLIWLYHFGSFPKNQIDHINRNREDNRIENLRIADHSINGKNRNIGINNTSGIIGVTLHKRSKKWQAQIGKGGKTTYLGCFDSFNEAVIARRTAEFMNNFHTNHGRTPEGGE